MRENPYKAEGTQDAVEPAKNASLWRFRASVAIHLSGAFAMTAFKIEDIHDVNGIPPVVLECVMLWGLITLIACPVIMGVLLLTTPLNKGQAATLMTITILISMSQCIALIPTIQ